MSSSPCASAVANGPSEEGGGRDRALRVPGGDDRLAVQRQQHRGQLGRRIRMRDAAAHGAAAARGRMADVAQRFGQQRRARRHERGAQRIGLAGRGSEPQRPVGRDARERRDAADVDERRRPRQPQVEHGHETLPAGQHLCVLAELRKRRDRLLDGLDGAIGKGSGLHGGASLSACTTRGQTPGRARAGENRDLHQSWISWVVVAVGAAVLWSCVGIDRTRAAALRRRLLLGAGLVALGFVSFAVTGDSSGGEVEARRVADAFTLARLTGGPAAARRYLAPAAAPLAAQLPARPPGTEASARRLVGTGVALDCGQTPILQFGSRSERCVHYADGSRVFLWRHDGRWFVVGFTLR